MAENTGVRTYAGIGSRRAPDDVLALCIRIAAKFRRNGWRLRSGHSIGCDQAFEVGARGEADVFLPWKDFEAESPVLGRKFIMPSVPALEVVGRYHPAVERLSMSGMRLHARNAHIILGASLNDPASYVLCWTPDEQRSGTAMGLRIARAYNIPVHNLNDPEVRELWESW